MVLLYGVGRTLNQIVGVGTAPVVSTLRTGWKVKVRR